VPAILYKINKIATGRLSKLVGAMLPAFQKRIVNGKPICRISKPARLPLPVFKSSQNKSEKPAIQ
jgi:hypothetical protein